MVASNIEMLQKWNSAIRNKFICKRKSCVKKKVIIICIQCISDTVALAKKKKNKNPVLRYFHCSKFHVARDFSPR